MLIFNDEALERYRDSDCCVSLHRLYSELEQPIEPHAQGRHDIFDDDDDDDDSMNTSNKFDDFLPRTKKSGGGGGVVESMDVEPPSGGSAGGAAGKVRVPVSEPPTSASVYKLFGYFSEAWIAALALPYEDVKETVLSRCGSLPDLQREVVERRPQLERTIETFVQRLVLELFTVDERGAKIRQIMAELEETYLLGEVPRRSGGTSSGASAQRRAVIRQGKANFINVDAVNRSVAKTYRESTSGNDEFYRKCSDAKKRGRRPTADKNQQPDRIDQLKSGHILSQKSVAPITYSEADDKFYTLANALQDQAAPGIGGGGPTGSYAIQSTVDFYPVFLKVLSNFYHCIPSDENYGVYLKRLNAAVRLLTPQQWPMHGLVRSLMNAECIYPLRRVVVPGASGGGSGTQYKCAYSGLALRPGEQVWLVRVLVNDGARYLKWVSEGKLPPCPMTAPEFTRSVRAYFVKCSVAGTRSLFFTPSASTGAKKVQHTSPISIPTKALIPTKVAPQPDADRIVCVNTMWVLLNQLRHFIQQEELGQHIYSQRQRQIPYQLLAQQLVDLLSQQAQLHGALFIGALVNTLTQTDVRELVADEQAARYVAMLQDAVLDFIDLMFPCRPAGTTTGGGGGAVMMRRTFSLHRLGIKSDEKSKIASTLCPVVSSAGAALQLLPALFAQSDARGASGINGATTHDDKMARMDRLEQLLVQHPLVFMALFQVIYEPQALAPLHRLSFRQANRLLCCLNLFINTDPTLATHK